MHRFLAAIMFFTRLPLWRIVNVPPEAFRRLVDYWSLAGWLTGGTTATTLWLATMVFPLPLAAVIALSIRLILTGALHEDGFADFFDGMGGGGTRERILAIMKDSHIGSYGVISLIVYFLLCVLAIGSMPIGIACATLFAADPWSKFCASQIINTLPYARKESEAKNHTVYERMSAGAFLLSLVAGALPLLLMPGMTKLAALAPVLTTALLIAMMRRRLGGYTGDCCGATFLIGELAFLLTTAAIIGHT